MGECCLVFAAIRQAKPRSGGLGAARANSLSTSATPPEIVAGAASVATGRVVRMGSRIAVAHMELENDDAELIATGSAAYVVG